MKKSLSLALAVLMLFSMFPIASADGPALEERSYPFYIASVEDTTTEPIPLTFVNGVSDLPYMDLESWAELVSELFVDGLDLSDYQLAFTSDGSVATLTRENGYTMTVDAEKDTISFVDYNSFLRRDSEDTMLIDILSASGFNEEGENSLFQRNRQASFDRYGREITINLADYAIDVFVQDGKFYIPLQTLNDIVLSPACSLSILFNGEALFFGNAACFVDEETGDTNELYDLYYGVPKRSISDELAEYNYNELCLAFDTLYGLKGPHDIETFRQTFWEIGFDEALSSTNPADSDLAVHQFLNYYLDDQHSSYLLVSPYSGSDSMDAHVDISSGTATGIMDEHMFRYKFARMLTREDEVPPYEEVGNTAYITFDDFVFGYDPEEYYASALGEDAPLDDTVGLIIYAHNQIYREGSPIENVVIDLSNNTGGQADAAVFVISWVLCNSYISLKDTFTGAMSNAVYRADVNLDRKFDADDSILDKNVFCLISPVSFSCGNLVPAALKESQIVSLIGTKSGGGSCVVQPMSSATGSLFNISGSHRLSFLKNGSFYDIDEGVEPDYPIRDIKHYYDRQALTDYINGLF